MKDVLTCLPAHPDSRIEAWLPHNQPAQTENQKNNGRMCGHVNVDSAQACEKPLEQPIVAAALDWLLDLYQGVIVGSLLL
ncbi:MAG: hypothetical protein ACREXO_05580 [Advenella sp.]